jgi:hypothetical protein
MGSCAWAEAHSAALAACDCWPWEAAAARARVGRPRPPGPSRGLPMLQLALESLESSSISSSLCWLGRATDGAWRASASGTGEGVKSLGGQRST